MKFETIDDKYLFDNISRFEAGALDIKTGVRKHRKIWLVTTIVSFALFLMFFSLAMFSYESPNLFFSMHSEAEGFKAFLNIFYLFGASFFISLILFLTSFSSLYSKIISKFEIKKFYNSFKKINSDDFQHDLEFEDKYTNFSDSIQINTFYKYDFPYSIIFDNKMKRFVFSIAFNIFSDVFYYSDITALEIEYNDKKIKQSDLYNNNGFFGLNELFDSENNNELNFVHNCDKLILNVIMKDSKVFPIIFINEKLSKKKMLKEYSVIENLKIIYNTLTGYNWK